MGHDDRGDRSDPRAARRQDRLKELHGLASVLMIGLDELGLHEAAAYVSLARRRIADQHPTLALSDQDRSQPQADCDST